MTLAYADDPNNNREHSAERDDRLYVHGRHPLSGHIGRKVCLRSNRFRMDMELNDGIRTIPIPRPSEQVLRSRRHWPLQLSLSIL